MLILPPLLPCTRSTAAHHHPPIQFRAAGHQHGLKNQSVFIKTGEIGPDQFYWFLVNRLMNLIFLKNGLSVLVPVIPTDKPVLPTDLPVSADFNHYRLTDLSISIPVYRSYRPIYRFMTSQI
jgi:hypothetical protein